MPRADLLSRLRLKPRDVPMLCVSLKMLAVAADTSAAAPLAIQTCYGLNRVLGYVLDESNRDIILYGRQDPLYPAIHFADICTFVQNLWHDMSTMNFHGPVVRWIPVPGRWPPSTALCKTPLLRN
jgi:hypothetical protein